MKAPAKIYVIQESIRISPSKSPAIIGDWATTKTFAHDTEYIRRDVVIDVMNNLIDLAECGNCPDYDINKLLDKTIDNADKD